MSVRSAGGRMDPARDPRAWWRYGVIYQVYPRSFQDSDGDGIGDLPGLISRLDHLRGGPDALGVDAIWLTPFYPSPLADWGYDVADYCDVAPEYGTLADFDRLVAAAHARGLRIIVDFIPNHTSDLHPWFRASRRARDDPRRGWYIWRDPAPGGGVPNNWRVAFPGREQSVWTWDEATGQYYLHSFLPQQPDLDWSNPDVRDAMEDVLRFWLDRGVDGFRIDVAHRMAKDPLLRDNEEHRPGYHGPRGDEDWPEVHEIHRRFRRLLDAYGPDRMAVGEVYRFDPADLARYYGDGSDELHLAFDFLFLKSPWRAEAFRAAVAAFDGLVPPDGWPDYALDNHDNPRVPSRYDEGGQGQGRARVAAAMLLTLRGTPFLYYGDELGLFDTPIPPERARDPIGRDPARTPMPWEPGRNAGFTTGEPWLPLGPDASWRNVAVERGDPASMLTLQRRLLAFRRASPALRWGSYRPLDAGPDVFAFLRTTEDERLLVVLPFADRPQTVAVPGLAAAGELVLSTEPDRRPGPVTPERLDLAAHEALIVRLP